MSYTNFTMMDREMLMSKLHISRPSLQRYLFRYERIFASTVVDGKDVLDIGAGNGLLSCIVSMAGARSVTALEPEDKGSKNGMIAQFSENIHTFGMKNVVLMRKTLQDVELSNGCFDIVASLAAVNHWDEEACMNLGWDENARVIYVNLFHKILRSLKTGGKLLLFDAGRLNLFSWVSKHWGIDNPLNPSIEYYKHQQPRLWAKLLMDAGFVQVGWRWLFPLPSTNVANRVLDTPLLNNAFMAYLTTSKFVIHAGK